MNSATADYEQDMNERLRECYDEMGKYDSETIRRNTRIVKAIGNFIGKGFVTDLENLIEDCECRDRFSLVDEPKGDFQRESNYGCITGIWVVQHSQGMEGDSYYGTVTVKLRDYKYLEMPFNI